MKKRIIIVMLLLLLIGGGYSYYSYSFKKSKELEITVDKKVVINLSDKVYNTDAVKIINNGKIISKKELIDSSKVGEQEIIIEVEDYFKNISTYKYKVIVEDNIAPEIKYSKNLSVEEGNKIDLLKNVEATDNYDKDIKVEVEGDYDLNKVGTYKLYYVAKDSSENEKKEEFELKVTKKVVIEKPVEEKKTVESDTKNEETKQEVVETPSTTDGTFTTSKGFQGVTKNGITYIDGVLIANKTYSLPSTYAPGLSSTVTSKFNEMAAAAKNEKGFNLYIASGYRSYSSQKTIYNRYVQRDGKAKADTYSARAGYSEHQSGLAYDVCDRNVGACINSNFNTTDQAIWLKDNAYRWGFILRYPEGKTNETGYKWESWHFRYVGVDLATKLYNNGNWITLENYFGITSQYSN